MSWSSPSSTPGCCRTCWSSVASRNPWSYQCPDAKQTHQPNETHQDWLIISCYFCFLSLGLGTAYSWITRPLCALQLYQLCQYFSFTSFINVCIHDKMIVMIWLFLWWWFANIITKMEFIMELEVVFICVYRSMRLCVWGFWWVNKQFLPIMMYIFMGI